MSSIDFIYIAALHRALADSPRLWSRLVRHILLTGPIAVSQLHQPGWVNQDIVLIEAALAALDLSGTSSLLQRHQISVVLLGQSAYPTLLTEIPSPPPILYYRGSLDCLLARCLAVVGTRRPTAYGLTVTAQLIPAGAAAGVTIISGLAYGIDAAAHRACLSAGGRTVAVLGCGLDQCYPPAHQLLAQEIVARGGAVISEFPLGAPPLRHHFPQRNRIISGLATATLLVEAGDKSGALITAKFAVDQNRDVLVIPGPITSPTSIGVNNWLKLGATPITTATDLQQYFSVPSENVPGTEEIHGDDPIEEEILRLLRSQPGHVDELTKRSRLDSSVVSATLSLLEMKGKVRHLGGMIFRLGQ